MEQKVCGDLVQEQASTAQCSKKYKILRAWNTTQQKFSNLESSGKWVCNHTPCLTPGFIIMFSASHFCYYFMVAYTSQDLRN